MANEDRVILGRLKDMICRYVLIYGAEGSRKIGGKTQDYHAIAARAGSRVGDNPTIYKRMPGKWYRVQPKGVWR